MKKTWLSAALAVCTALSLFAGTVIIGAEQNETKKSTRKIGVSIASTTDTLGSSVKKILDAAAAALDFQILYVDHGKKSQLVSTSVDQLCKVGCEGIIVCTTTDEEMDSVLDMCSGAGVYVAQFFSSIDPEAYPALSEKAAESKYYIGSVDERDEETGKTLVNMLLESGSRTIGLIARDKLTSACTKELNGIAEAVDEWNDAHASDPAIYLDPVYAGVTNDGAQNAAAALFEQDSQIDGVITVMCGDEAPFRVETVLAELGIESDIRIVSDNLIPKNLSMVENSRVIGGCGTNVCDPLYAFMMVTQAMLGEDPQYEGELNDLICQAFSVCSQADCDAYRSNFEFHLPYTNEEMLKMSEETPEQLRERAEKVTVYAESLIMEEK